MDIVREKMKEFVINQGQTLQEGEEVHGKPIVKLETYTSGFGLSTKDRFVDAEDSHKNQKELFNMAIGMNDPSNDGTMSYSMDSSTSISNKNTEQKQKMSTEKKTLAAQGSMDSFEDMLERDDSDGDDKIKIVTANPSELNLIVDTCQRILNNETSLGKTKAKNSSLKQSILGATLAQK